MFFVKLELFSFLIPPNVCDVRFGGCKRTKKVVKRHLRVAVVAVKSRVMQHVEGVARPRPSESIMACPSRQS